MSNNRLHNCKNPYQGEAKKVLCVCSAGLLRSPTAAVVLSKGPFNYNTRAVGMCSDYALIPIDMILLEWADEIVCMDHKQKEELLAMGTTKPIICLNITDSYSYRDRTLEVLIIKEYTCRSMGGSDEN